MTFKNTQAKNSLKTLNTLGHVELKKQAAGLNTIDVYVPWNLHEPRRGEFDFGRQVSHLSLENLQSSFFMTTFCRSGSASSQFSPFLNLTHFLELVKQQDMLAILR